MNEFLPTLTPPPLNVYARQVFPVAAAAYMSAEAASRRLMRPLPGVIGHGWTRKGHDKIVQRHQKKTHNE